MADLLLVPICIDALILKNGTSVSEAMAEFNRLPYVSREKKDAYPAIQERDVYPDIVNLSESIVSQPFQNKNLYLKAGIHLHWALPDTLTKQNRDGTFPEVPNRWLVRRKVGEKTDSWIIESDYLYSPSEGFQEDSITYPYKYPYDKDKGKNDPHSPLFIYLGRKLALADWNPKSSSESKYLDRLTAVGYGEPTFAAFYPNCRSVFGFHDPTKPDHTEIQYDVIGWYSKTDQNYLSEFLTKLKNNNAKVTLEAFNSAIKEELKWGNFTLTQINEAPQIICHSRLTISEDRLENFPLETSKIKLAVASTGTEALSAYLAETLADKDKLKKNIIEEQLEALQFAESLESQQLDNGPKFHELRHEAGFNAVNAGSLWRIRLDTQDNSENIESLKSFNLPSEFAVCLDALNQKQQEYDRAIAEIISRRRQLFSDWYKYMVSTYPPEDSWDNYPDTDAVKHYIETQGLSSLQTKVNATNSISAEIAEHFNSLNDQIVIYNNKNQQKTICLESVVSPRYWEPKEPVVLIVGDVAEATQRHGQDGRLNSDGLLECHIIHNQEINYPIAKDFDFDTIFVEIDKLKPSDPKEEKIGFSTWKKQPWNPILMEWLVELFPVADGGNKTSVDHNYSKEFLTKNYALQTQDVDLSPKQSEEFVVDDANPNRIKTDQDSNIYSGFSILTPYANLLLQKRIEEYLKKYKKNDDNPAKFENPIYKKICDYEENKLDKIPNPIATAILAQKELKNLKCLSQSLGGFNEALLMHKQTLQLSIDEPIAFQDYQEFSDRVSKAVAGEIKSAPQPLDDFSPIRSGEMRIIDLQLIDTFGQVRKLNWKNEQGQEYVIKPESMMATNDRIVLPPRFVQPCRINFRWLSAEAGDPHHREMNDHPGTHPICGWILPNNLNGSLMIYSAEGSALGSINLNADWDDAPGSSPLAITTMDGKEIPNIPNSHLHKVVKSIIALGKDFLANFNLCLNNALDNIDPVNFAQHQSVALLMGRPIAVVRASVNLELQGLPAINQDWNVFRQEMQLMLSMEERDTDNFVAVDMPIRIGEYKQLNDGVIGYWKEVKDGSEEGYKYENDIFYAQQSDNNESKYIETQFLDREMNPEVTEGPINIIQSINSSPQILTMLVDPRGVFHATSGVLPTKVISLPHEQYADALDKIQVTFLTAPILSDRTNQGRLNLPLPSAPDYDWSWLERKGDKWSEILTAPVIEKEIFTKAFTKYCAENKLEKNAEKAWDELLDQNWLHKIGELDTPIKAKIVSKDNRSKDKKNKPLEGDLKELDEVIQRIFDLYEISIDPVTSQAIFSGDQEIREGWLVLSHVKNLNSFAQNTTSIS